MKPCTLTAAAIVVAANAVALIGTAWNRSGTPEAVVELTDRELPLNHAGEDNTGRWVNLTYQQPPGWLDASRLANLGFDPAARKQLPRGGYVALEYQAEAEPTGLATRLVPVDADRDALRLRERHPDRGRVLVLRARFQVWPSGQRLGATALTEPRTISIPAEWVRGVQPGSAHYRIRLAVGRRYEPYAISFQRLP